MSDGKLGMRARKEIFLGYAQGEYVIDYVTSRKFTFDEFSISIGRNDCCSVYTDLDSIRPKFELQLETLRYQVLVQ